MKSSTHYRFLFLLLLCIFYPGVYPKNVSADDPWIWPVTWAKPHENYVKQICSVNHSGIDIAIGLGNQVRAARSGTVVISDDTPDGTPPEACINRGVSSSKRDGMGDLIFYYKDEKYLIRNGGKIIVIDHHDGTFSEYAHLDTRNVETGWEVSAGQQIGTVGMTGCATGYHLHFSIKYAPGAKWNGSYYALAATECDFLNDYYKDFLDEVPLTKVKPEGAFESVTTTDDGQITISGWAYDPKSPNTNIDLRVTVLNPGETKPTITLKVNNVQRTDNKKGFSLTFPTDARGNWGVSIEALGTTAASDPADSTDIGYQYVTIADPLYPREITLNQSSLSLEKGSAGNLSVTSYQPNDAKNKTITWSSSDTSIATVSSSGKVTAKSVGSATITASINGRTSVKAECMVTVTAPPAIPPTSVTLNKTSAELTVNDQLTLTANVLPTNTNVSYSLKWTSSDTNVATVSNGVVTAVGEGNAEITVTVKYDALITFCKTSLNVTVVQPAEESCDWVEKSYLPPNVNSDKWEIEVRNHYSQTGSTSPGSGWTQSGSGTTTYVATGEYVSWPHPRDEANDTTFVLVDQYYYHFCSTSGDENADYYQYGKYTRNQGLLNPQPMDLSYYRVINKTKDDHNDDVFYYELAWSDVGTAATGKTGTVYCDHTPSPSKYWYLTNVYEMRQPVQTYTWTRDSEWLSGADQADSSADSFTYRFRLKGCDAVSYKVTFKVVNGSWDDGTTANKSVTLSGIASDTLMLTASQIPSAGTKPNTNYTTGQWGVTPNTTTRIKADTTYTYTYAQKNAISSTVTFKVLNGAWSDGTNADKIVTLEGFEGDTLKLTAEQIPAVGTNPASNFKAGSWDTTPSADTAILGNKTYTYTYAAKNTISRTVTFKVVNGSWDDGTTADKMVTLNGYEGDTLTLASADIPAVGNKPNETYKAGSWDITPDTTTAITGNKTFTYTYAVDENDHRVKLVVSSERARPGEEVTVGVSIENNPGFAILKLRILYDKTRLSLLGKTDTGVNGWNLGNDIVMLEADQNIYFEGELLKLKFKVLETSEEGDGTVTINFNTGDMHSFEEERINPVIQAGNVNVYKNIPGDINGDGFVDTGDLLRLRRFLLDIPVILVGNADVNNDGLIDTGDLLRLRRYLLDIPVVLF